ncbi:uncharacterized protein LOC129279872 isoform X1 [Lytechinus pictus]|uniref:uncharacterized protein LOC129279872 isoform X1 n=1 Tax=Lytechinus pictus TaxID=7653 RepID=UPI0030B9B446
MLHDNMTLLHNPGSLVILITYGLCIFPPATSSDKDCLPYCTYVLDKNTTPIDITTPGYPSNYPQDVNLLWTFQAPSGCGLSLTVNDLELATGDTFRFGQHKAKTQMYEADDDLERVVNSTFSFATNELVWVTFSSDIDNVTDRGIWLTVAVDPDPTDLPDITPIMDFKSPVATDFMDLPLVSLEPTTRRRLGVSIPLAVGLTLVAFGLGVAVVCAYHKKKRSTANASTSDTRPPLGMCNNPMNHEKRDMNLTTHQVSPALAQTGPMEPGLKNHYYEIGEGEYNLLFGTPGPHVYQEISKNPRGNSKRSGSTASCDGSKRTLSAELDVEFCELTNMIDNMLHPVSKSQRSLGAGSLDGSGSHHASAGQRSRANTADIPRVRHAFVTPAQKPNTVSRPQMPVRKYAIGKFGVNPMNMKLKGARSVGSIPIFMETDIRNANCGQSNPGIGPTYQPLRSTASKAHVAPNILNNNEQPGYYVLERGPPGTISSADLTQQEYFVLESQSPGVISPVGSLILSDGEGWEIVDIVHSLPEQRRRANTSDQPRKLSGHYTALRSTSLLATPQASRNIEVLDKRLAKSNPNLNAVGVQLWNNLRKSSESLTKTSPGYRDGLRSFVSDAFIEEDETEEKSIYQPLSRPASMVDSPQTSNPKKENTQAPQQSQYETLRKNQTQVRPVMEKESRSSHLVNGDMKDDGEYNEIDSTEQTYQPLSRPASLENLTSGWTPADEITSPPLPSTQYEMNRKSVQIRPTVDVVLGRELTTVGSFQLVSPARRSDKMASATIQRPQTDENDYDELDMENGADATTETNLGNLYIDILDEFQDVPTQMGLEHTAGNKRSGDKKLHKLHHLSKSSGTRNSQETASSIGKVDVGPSQPTGGATLDKLSSKNRLSTTSGVYSSIGLEGSGDDLTNGEGIYSAISGDSSDEDDDIHEYISVDDVCPR